MIFIPASNATWFGLSDSFWGALIGAAISGIFAISVFVLSKRHEIEKEKDFIKSTKILMNFVHENIKFKIERYIEEFESGNNMSKEVDESLSVIEQHSIYLSHIDYKGLFLDPNVLKNTVRYVEALNNIIGYFQIHNKANYGYVMLNKNEFKKNYIEMNKSINELNN